MMREHLKQMDLGGLCTFCLCKNAEESEQNEWTAAPDHSEKKEEEKTQREMRKEIAGILNLRYLICVGFSLKLMEQRGDVSHGTTPHKQGCLTKRRGGRTIQPAPRYFKIRLPGLP